MQRLRLSARRWALDGFLVALAAGEVASVLFGPAAHEPAAALITAVSPLVLLGRRRQPLLASLASFGALALLFAVYPTTTLIQFFGLLATFAIVGAVNSPRDAVVAWLFGTAVVAYDEATAPSGGGTGDILLTVAVVTLLWGAGFVAAHRARSAEAAVHRAEQAERDRHEHAARAVTEERARLARELHDVVSHGLSVIVLQTMAARAELADGPERPAPEVDRHLDAVEEIARESLAEMRRMLGLLQPTELDAPPDDPESPAPGLRSLPALVERAKAAGLGIGPVELPTDAELPGGLELAVYRVVQEALTNAVKHAPGARAAVSVSIDEDRVVVTVTNGPAAVPARGPSGAGHGLIGMRQRAALYDGTLAAGPRPDGGFEVTATFPLDDGPQAARPRRRFLRREASA